jgi:hypothetical protein
MTIEAKPHTVAHLQWKSSIGSPVLGYVSQLRVVAARFSAKKRDAAARKFLRADDALEEH